MAIPPEAIISDGTTDIKIGLTDEIVQRLIERNQKSSASGALKQQVAGSRVSMVCKARVTGAVLESVYNLLTNGSEFYFYTPTDTHSLLASVTFPLPVLYSSVKHAFDNRKIYYLTFKIESIDYIEC